MQPETRFRTVPNGTSAVKEKPHYFNGLWISVMRDTTALML